MSTALKSFRPRYMSDESYEGTQQIQEKVDAMSDTILHHREWNEKIQDTLIAWFNLPSLFDDDDFEPPNRKTILAAISLARLMKENDCLPPTRIVPSVDGGVILETAAAPFLVTIEILNCGRVENIVFEHGKVKRRTTSIVDDLA